jgi:hypothetical protein
MDYDKKKEEFDDPDIVVADAQPIQGGSNEPPIPAGHSRFYCSKCHTVGFEGDLAIVLQLRALNSHSY